MQLGANSRLQVSPCSSYIVLADELRLKVLIECLFPGLIMHHGAVSRLNINQWPHRQTIKLLLVGSTECCVRISEKGQYEKERSHRYSA
jgi:hypothetical protein